MTQYKLVYYTSDISIAIVKYIRMKYNLPDHWYPLDLHKRVLVEQYLHWHPGNIRCNAFYLKVCTHNYLNMHIGMCVRTYIRIDSGT